MPAPTCTGGGRDGGSVCDSSCGMLSGSSDIVLLSLLAGLPRPRALCLDTLSLPVRSWNFASFETLVRVFACILTVCLAIPVNSIAAQQPWQVRPGSQLRVTVTAGRPNRVVGEYLALHGDTLELEVRNTLVLVPLAAVERLELNRPKRSYMLAGSSIGFILGGGVGLLVSGAGSGLSGVTIGGVGGALVGAAVAAASGKDLWEQVWSYQLGVIPTATFDGRLGLAGYRKF